MIGFWTRFRIAVCGAVFAALALLIVRRSYELQVRQHDKLKSWAEDNYLKEVEIPPRRGRIFDRNGKELASTAEFDSISCNPRLLAGVPDAPRKLGKALNVDVRDMKKILSSRRAFAWLKRKVSPQEAAAVKALAYKGVDLQKEPGRFYPFNDLGATVIGHAGIDGKGLEGVELSYEKYLHGTGSQVLGFRDGKGRDLLVDGLADPTAAAGKDVVLSLDKFLTYTTEQALLSAVHKYNAKAAMSVMIDPHTGEILAMASVPSYNANTPGDASVRGATKNRVITEAFEPGSIMKTFTFAAALDAGTLKLNQWFDCMWGRMPIGKVTIRDSHPLGTLIAADVFKHSSNIGTTKIARQLGREPLYDALTRFGFGRKSGIGLDGERGGQLRPVSQWGEVAFANIAFGQGLTVTPLQMATGYAAIASGGVYHPPRLGLRMVYPDGRSEPIPLAASARPEQRIMSETAARTLLGIMHGVTDKDGTGRAATIAGYSVGGKTGTAQKVVNGHYNDRYWMASFIGVIPAENPRLVIAVMLDEPWPEHQGGQVAAPVFKEIAEAAVRYLNVPPNEPSLVLSARKKDRESRDSTRTPRASEAELTAALQREIAEGPGTDQADLEPLAADGEASGDSALSEEGLSSVATTGEDETTMGDGSDRSPKEGHGPGKGELVDVPSFKGMSIGQAIVAARRVGLELAPEGSGVAVGQSPTASQLPRGAVCRVSFRPGG